MSISIEYRNNGGAWQYLAGFSSLDAAKTSCRELRKNGLHGYHNMDFSIYHNDSLFLVNAQKSGWRLRWIPGSGMSRKEQL
jgi:hypothetical protein